MFVCYSLSPDGGALTLLRLRPADSGTYTCLAVSPAGQESKIYTLSVLGQSDTPTLPVWERGAFPVLKISGPVLTQAIFSLF